MSFDDGDDRLLKKEPRKGIVGMERRRRALVVVVVLGLVKSNKGAAARWNAAELRKVAVVMFVRVSDVRMRLVRVGKRMEIL